MESLYKFQSTNKLHESILNEMHKNYTEIYPEFERDVSKLASDLMFFEIKYGLRIELRLGEYKPLESIADKLKKKTYER